MVYPAQQGRITRPEEPFTVHVRRDHGRCIRPGERREPIEVPGFKGVGPRHRRSCWKRLQAERVSESFRHDRLAECPSAARPLGPEDSLRDARPEPLSVQCRSGGCQRGREVRGVLQGCSRAQAQRPRPPPLGHPRRATDRDRHLDRTDLPPPTPPSCPWPIVLLRVRNEPPHS
jgi:hypothetical protein